MAPAHTRGLGYRDRRIVDYPLPTADRLPTCDFDAHAAVRAGGLMSGPEIPRGRYDGQPVPAAALELAPYVFVRRGELRALPNGLLS
jgi:hypothetical protein